MFVPGHNSYFFELWKHKKIQMAIGKFVNCLENQ